MARLFTPALLRRGLQIFFLISAAGFAATLFYGKDPAQSLAAVRDIRWPWLLVGLGLASMDWIGGGLRLWVVARVVHPNPPLGGMMLAGGMSAWASYLTPLQSGAGPMMIYTMRRFGVPVPVAMTSTLMTFIATVLFFALAGPLAIVLGAGRALGAKQAVLGLSLYDLFIGSLGIFVGLAALLIGVMVFPKPISAIVHRLAGWAGRKHEKVAARLEGLRAGIDQAHASLVQFNTPRGWLALLWATLLSGPSHANKLLAGYVAMRTIGIEAHFVDILLLQTLITFLLYFAPTPGASGIAEVLAALIMASYVPKPLTPLYTLVWRLILSYYTIAFGFFVFSFWVRHGLKGIGDGGGDGDAEPAPPEPALQHADG
ncbi:MAG TPA: lysylphosphatidylglycerol synthase transmembrane domain-containing protein [Gemmatimonadales bacterium]|nr:lysylphosphatidylglycerol synthase transmembrane domain-containing protein [Gemmatimonadales bacterium]